MYNKLENKQWMVAGLSTLVMTQGQLSRQVIVENRKVDLATK
ncbi:hypothetical protein [Weissella cibaria]|nr:hypothetical protein [Weissella cibaria]MDK9678980.1 hypothetical protein [Weissella cibaria]